MAADIGKRLVPDMQVGVRCDGHLHRIEIVGGRLRFPDHDYRVLALENKLRIAAGIAPACRCEAVLRLWRGERLFANREALNGDPLSWPPDLENARHKVIRFHGSSSTVEISNPRERIRARVEAEATDALYRAGYRRSTSSWAGGDHNVNVSLGAPAISGRSSKAWSHNGKWTGTNSNLQATVRPSWLHKVFSKGLSIVYDPKGSIWVFVLDVMPERDALVGGKSVLRPGQVMALVGRQGRGFDVTATTAIVDVAAKRIVRWRTKAMTLVEVRP